MNPQISDFTNTNFEDLQLEGIDFITSGNQYLTFCLGDEHYGVDILQVTEIRGWEAPTLIPNALDYVKGVINIRGVIVPIVDLRLRFSVGNPDYLPTTVVIVLTVDSEQGSCTMGFVVNSVSDVLNADDDEIQKAPEFGTSISGEYIDGLVNTGDNIVTLLNIQQLAKLDQ